MKTLAILFSFSFCLVMVSCQKENIIDDEPSQYFESKRLSQVSLKGKLQSSQPEIPLEGTVSVFAASGIQNTDIIQENAFKFESIEDLNALTSIQINADGYFPKTILVNLQEGQNDLGVIILNPKETTGSFDATSGGSISINPQTSIDFPSEAIVSVSGGIYLGEVIVFAIPTNKYDREQILTQSNGKLNHISEAHGYEILLETPEGDKLNLQDGKSAKVSLELSPNSNDQLFVQDQQTGYFKPGGKWTKKEGKLIWELPHFSRWLFGAPSPSIDVSFDIQVQGFPDLTHTASVKIGYVSFSVVERLYEFSSASGSYLIEGFPANEDILLLVYDPCGNLVIQENYGAHTSDIDLGTINIDLSSFSVFNISGTISACNNNSLPNGQLVIQYDNKWRKIFDTDQSGFFELPLPWCGNTFELELNGYDESFSSKSLTNSIQVSNNSDITGLNILLCEENVSFLNVSFEGNQYFYEGEGFSAKISDNGVFSYLDFDYVEESIYPLLNAFLPATALINDIGIYETMEDSYFILREDVNSPAVVARGMVPPDLQVSITKYANHPDSSIEGSFNGMVAQDSFGLSGIPISGSFRMMNQ